MATTSPDNIEYPVNSDQVAPLASHFKNLADSTQAALDNKVNDDDARLSDERTPLDNSVTSSKIADGTIVNSDISATAAIDSTKIAGTAVTRNDSGTVTGTMIAQNTILGFNIQNGSILNDDIGNNTITSAKIADGTITSAKIADGTITGADIADSTIESVNLAEQDYIKFDTTYTGGSTQPGELAWDPDNETLQFQLDPHVTLQIGQEHVMRIKNNSGSVAIPERTVVMFAGATGDTITVSPAVSDGSINVNYLAGITTEEIPADGFGFITQLGFINQVNTNAWPVGTILYVDPSTPGGLTDTEPESPAWTMPVAAVTKQNSSAGRLLVRAIPAPSLGDAALLDVGTTSGTVAAGDDSRFSYLVPYPSWPHRKYLPGTRYETVNFATALSSSRVNGFCVAVPFVIMSEIEAKSLTVYSAIASSGANVRLGIYSANADDIPEDLILDAGLVSTSTTGFKTVTISQILQPGLYYLAESRQSEVGASATIAGTPGPIPFAPHSQSISMNSTSIWMATGNVFGALPSKFTQVNNPPALSTSGLAPRIWIGF